jgi:ribosomal-protein-alanine acetyltransferase
MSGTMNAGLAFLPLAEADIDTLVALDARICQFPWTRGNFMDSLTANHGCWLAREESHLVGYGVLSQVLDEAHLLNIGVAPELRRHGRGTTLLLHLFGLARAQGAARMFLEVRRSNLSAQRLYLRHEFIQIGERRAYYQAEHEREDAIVMARDL